MIPNRDKARVPHVEEEPPCELPPIDDATMPAEAYALKVAVMAI
jgi:hypothetical protein